MSEPESNPTDAPPDQADSIRRATSGFRRLAMIVLAAAGVLVLVAAGTMATLYFAATADVPEYEAVVRVDPVQAETARKELESQLSTLASDTQQLEEWTSRITARQINAWLALRLEREMPGFAEAGLVAPRVMLADGLVTLAARSTASAVDGVVTVSLAPMITDAGEVALDITSAKIGRLSLPIEPLIAQLQRTPLANLGPIRFAVGPEQAAIIIDPERLRVAKKRVPRLTGIDVRDGEILLRGESEPVER